MPAPRILYIAAAVVFGLAFFGVGFGNMIALGLCRSRTETIPG